MTFSVTSSAFQADGTIPRNCTCDGGDAAPPLTVSNTPAGTASFALIMDDPDAPRGTFTHWLAYDIPAADGPLRADDGRTLKNDFGRQGYGGPCPPPGHGVHRYQFTVYAVDVESLELKGRSRKDLEAALDQHTLARARVTGRYERAG